MEIHKCLNCMSDIESTICPQCGFDESKTYDDPFVLRPKTILRGRYLVGRVIGQGGFGITYVGVDLVLNLKVAIKEYYPMGMVSRDHTASNNIHRYSTMISEEMWSQGCEGFIKEAREMARFNDLANVVRVRDTFLENQTAYIVMDFVEGVTLKEWLKNNGTISYDRCVSMMEPLMQDLSKMHKKGLIHRDISPDNIMVRVDGSLCLLDLGAAKDIRNQTNGQSRLVVKNGFSPIEQYMEEGEIGPWTDVYALCATMYYSMIGQLIPDATDRAWKKVPFEVNSQWESLVSTETVRIIKTGLAVEYENRIQNIDILLACMKNDLKNVRSNIEQKINNTHEITVPVETVDVTKEKEIKKKSPKGLVTAIIVAIVVVLVITIVALAGGKDKSKENEDEKPDTIVENVLTVEKIGNSNANILNDGGYAIISGEYEYFLDQDKNLCVCTYNTEDKIFYIDESVVAAENVVYICLGEDGVYYCQMTDNEYVNYICRMDFDGSNIEIVSEQQAVMFMQYAKLSDGQEYIYLLDVPEGDEISTVVRLDIQTGEMDPVITDAMWFNLYKDAIYYTCFDGSNWVLMKSDLSGNHATMITDTDIFPVGFVEDDHMYMYAYNGEYYARLSLNGDILNTYYNIPLSDYYTISYGNGWVYYADHGNKNVHRMRPDGSGDEVIYQGGTIVSINYNGQWIWLFEKDVETENPELSKVYLAYRDGTSLLDVTDSLYGSEESVSNYDPAILDAPIATIEEFSYELNEEGEGMVITGYNGELKEFWIPEEIEGYPVTEIGEKAFFDSDVQKIQLPNTVEFIWQYAFSESQLSYIGLSDNLLGIAVGAFSHCYSLCQVELPTTVQVIGDRAFYACNLSEVMIPENVIYIGSGAFAYLDTSAFESFTLASLGGKFDVHEGVLYEYDSQSDARILHSFPGGKDVESGYYTVEDGTNVILGYAFDNCQQLYDVVIPASVTEIHAYAFRNCSNLQSVYIENPDCIVDEDAFSGCDYAMSVKIQD